MASYAPPPTPPPQTLNFVSKVFGDNMVLQQAPQQAVIWGYSKTANALVTTTFAGQVLKTSADKHGHWQQKLPPTPASDESFTLTIKSSSGEKATLSNVLFGEVILCSGQSNMGYQLNWATNNSEELAAANAYPTIRLFDVGEYNRSAVPFDDLQRVKLPWAVTSSRSVSGFSAVCWFVGRRLSDALTKAAGHAVPG